MSSLKKLLRFSTYSIAILLCSFFIFIQSAIAQDVTGMSDFERIVSADISGGTFTVNIPNIPIKNDLRIGSAIVSLPDGETGTIDEISITSPNGKVFGCKNLKIQQGTDLIQACGGFAYLKTGTVTYSARGSNFKPQADVKFSVTLSD